VPTHADKFPDLPILQLIFLTSAVASMLQNQHQSFETSNTVKAQVVTTTTPAIVSESQVSKLKSTRMSQLCQLHTINSSVNGHHALSRHKKTTINIDC